MKGTKGLQGLQGQIPLEPPLSLLSLLSLSSVFRRAIFRTEGWTFSFPGSSPRSDAADGEDQRFPSLFQVGLLHVDEPMTQHVDGGLTLLQRDVAQERL